MTKPNHQKPSLEQKTNESHTATESEPRFGGAPDKPKIGQQKNDLVDYRKAEPYIPLPSSDGVIKQNTKKTAKNIFGASIIAFGVVFASWHFFLRKDSGKLSHGPHSLTTIFSPAPTVPSRTLVLPASVVDEKKTDEVRTMLLQGKVPSELQHASDTLKQEIIQSTRKYYSIKLGDWADVDGDIIQLSVDGTNLGFVALDHTVNTIQLPIKADTAATIEITAIADGGGGVTLTTQSSDGRVSTNVLQVGEKDIWTIRVK